MQQSISQEEIVERLKKLKDNDPKLPDITLPEWLPIPIQEVVKDFCVMTQMSQNDANRALGIDSYRAGVAYIDKALPAFTNESTKDVWNKLSPPELDLRRDFMAIQKAKKVAKLILHMENNIEYVLYEYDRIQSRIIANEERSIHLQESIRREEKFIRSSPFYNRDPSLFEFLQNAQSNHSKTSNTLKEKLGKITDFQTAFLPVTRQSKNTGHSHLYIHFLNRAFVELYGEPMHQQVCTLVRTIFKNPYSSDSIKSIISRRKNAKNTRTNDFVNAVLEPQLSGFVMGKVLGLWQVPSMKNEYSQEN